VLQGEAAPGVRFRGYCGIIAREFPIRLPAVSLSSRGRSFESITAHLLLRNHWRRRGEPLTAAHILSALRVGRMKLLESVAGPAAVYARKEGPKKPCLAYKHRVCCRTLNECCPVCKAIARVPTLAVNQGKTRSIRPPNSSYQRRASMLRAPLDSDALTRRL
jgi:hypothetical protein